MASVFLSYDREDLNFARPVAKALEKGGHSVWWDRHIKGGAQYAKEIEQALKAADAVVVLWSEHSIESAWVRDEAAAGRDSGRLVPVSVDRTEAPLGFRQYQTINLSGWKGRGRSTELRTLLEAVDALGAAKPEAPSTGAPIDRPARGHWSMLVFGSIALMLAVLFFWPPWAANSSTPVVAVTGAAPSAQSRSMANDLLVALGRLQEARADAVQLIGEEQSAQADLRFAVGGATQGQVSRATLALLDGTSGALLWSKDFERPRSEEPNLRQQIAFTAARALECALEGLAGEQSGLERPVLKLYLSGCAGIDAYENQYQLIPLFRQVTARAPKFEAGWAKLLHVEVSATLNNPVGDPALPDLLKKDIAEARKVNPHLAEAYLAEAVLLPPTHHEARLRLTDLATEHKPNGPQPFQVRDYYLRHVGRMKESVEAAKRAVELDPLSPTLRGNYSVALATAGQFDRARHELATAQRLWPESAAVRVGQYALQLRYGDPADALRLVRSGVPARLSEQTELFLRARINPTPRNIEAAVRHDLANYQRDPAAIALLIQTLGEFDREEELFPILLRADAAALVRDHGHVLFRPALREFRRDPRFMRVAQRIGLVTYWRNSGKWPDFCFEPDSPYDCKKEATKLF